MVLRVTQVFMVLTLFCACAEDPHKRPEENATAKRNAQIYKELESAQEYYLDGISLQTKIQQSTDPDEQERIKNLSQQKFYQARSLYSAILRRDDLEKVEGAYDRHQIRQMLIDLDARLLQIESTDTSIKTN